ncbi:hypothetical protein OGAPHI_002525 [Ogataea philodendri]|uniref:Factor arrest protein 11 n=1 Tax=Ogataea philodendri TaxID=1378263 RepID=A0A9P8PBZ7_9ASCO|nr:uncharacterized protein OGAPHI_002525 [Ogataea philodendri]KAH3668770.1 hypothetical protein OGAPHI_002525 [Ogataea philodendri]
MESDIRDLEVPLDDLDQFPGTIIDRGEMVETTDDQDILSSPHSSFSFGDDEEEDEREIDGLNNFNILLEYPELEYDYSELSSFENEYMDWFSSGDLKELASIRKLTSSNQSPHSLVKQLSVGTEESKLVTILRLEYIIMGHFGDVSEIPELKERILSNSKLFVSHETLLPILELVCNRMLLLSDLRNEEKVPEKKKLKLWSAQLYHAMTIVYTIVLSALVTKDKTNFLAGIIDTSQLLPTMMRSIDNWRWLTLDLGDKDLNTVVDGSVAHYFKVRNVILLLSKLIILQFGPKDHLDSTKSFLQYRYESTKGHVDTSGSRGGKVDTISPLDYQYFRKELITRYPTYTPPEHKVSDILQMNIDQDNSSSSRLINTSALLINQKHHLRNKMAVPQQSNPPEIHIATPAPSPTLTPQHTGGSQGSNISEMEHSNGQGRKKVFITQPQFPNLYPFSQDIPTSIQEATKIFHAHVSESFSAVQFTDVFVNFIRQEKGIPETKSSKFTYSEKDVDENPIFADEIVSLQRVEQFYHSSLPYLNSLAVVLVQIISSNVVQTQNYKSSDNPFLPPSRPLDISKLSDYDKQKLEVLRLKETCLKGASTIIFLLLKWFKMSHILKQEYFALLLFDNDFYPNMFRLLGSNQAQTQFENSFDFNDTETLLRNRAVYCDYEVLYDMKEYNFFLAATDSPSPKTPKYQLQSNDIFEVSDKTYETFIPPFNGQSRVKITRPNHRYCTIITQLLRSLYTSISNYKIQRIYKLLEVRPTENLRFMLTIYNANFYKPILKIIKLVCPFNGKKWRSNNMDLISFVYLFYKVGLRDQWLNNLFIFNLNERLKRSWENEYALRSLLKFYNSSTYPDQMIKFGYDDIPKLDKDMLSYDEWADI